MKFEIENRIAMYLEDKMRTIIDEKGENCNYDGGSFMWCDLKSVTTEEIEQFKKGLMNVIRKAIEDHSTFYVMCDSGKKPPRYRHRNYRSAQKEAKRLVETIGNDTNYDNLETARILLEYDTEGALPF